MFSLGNAPRVSLALGNAPRVSLAIALSNAPREALALVEYLQLQVRERMARGTEGQGHIGLAQHKEKTLVLERNAGVSVMEMTVVAFLAISSVARMSVGHEMIVQGTGTGVTLKLAISMKVRSLESAP